MYTFELSDKRIQTHELWGYDFIHSRYNTFCLCILDFERVLWTLYCKHDWLPLWHLWLLLERKFSQLKDIGFRCSQYVAKYLWMKDKQLTLQWSKLETRDNQISFSNFQIFSSLLIYDELIYTSTWVFMLYNIS